MGNKKKLIFVILFCIICILVTSILIMYKRIDIEEPEDDDTIQEETNLDESEQGIDLAGKYDANDLIIIDKTASIENVEFSYFEIDGLKDSTLQKNINKQIERLTLNSYKENINLDDVVNVSVITTCMANYGNTISLDMYAWGKLDDDSDDFLEVRKGLSIDLNTGNTIALEDLFTSNAPIEDILRNSVYYSIVSYNAEMNLSYDLVVEDYGNIEEDIADFIEQYKRGNITEFYYTVSEIVIFYGEDDYTINISMEDWADYITIYNKYLLDESIFASDDIGDKNLYTLSERGGGYYYGDRYYYSSYQNESNYLIEITIEWYEDDAGEFEEKMLADKIADIEKEISRIKVIANENKDSFYILNYNIYVDSYYEDSIEQEIINYMEFGNYYEMTVHDFEENVEPLIIDFYREATYYDFSYVYDLYEVLNIEPQWTQEYYNTETGEKVVV